MYETGIGTIPRPGEESARFLEGGYEYRRYFARAIGIRSLQAGIGVRGGGERRTFERRRGGNELTDTTTAGLIAGVAALRFRPAGRVSADVEWGNAAVLTRGRQHLVAGTESEKASWGGGWFTDFNARVNVRVAQRTSLAVAVRRPRRRMAVRPARLHRRAPPDCRGSDVCAVTRGCTRASGAGGAARNGRRLPHGARSAGTGGELADAPGPARHVLRPAGLVRRAERRAAQRGHRGSVIVHRSRARPLHAGHVSGVRVQLRRRSRLRVRPRRARVSGDRVVPFRRRSAGRRESVPPDVARGEPRVRHQRPRPRRHLRDERRPRVGARVRDVPRERPPFPVHVDADTAGAGAASRARVNNDAWKDLTAQAAYNTSASFLAWLLDMYGADRLRQIYGAPSREFADRINAVYGRALESLEADWLRFCDAWVG